MITDLVNKDIVIVLTLFSISPGSRFTRTDIKDKTGIHNVPLDQALESLIKNGILIKEKRLFSLNLANTTTKQILNIIRTEYLRFRELPIKIYSMMLDISRRMSSIKGIHQVYLFGSYAKLIYTEKSDVDLCIVLTKETHSNKTRVKKHLEKIERKYKRVIEAHFFEISEMKKKDPLIKEIKRNGIPLYFGYGNNLRT